MREINFGWTTYDIIDDRHGPPMAPDHELDIHVEDIRNKDYNLYSSKAATAGEELVCRHSMAPPTGAPLGRQRRCTAACLTRRRPSRAAN